MQPGSGSRVDEVTEQIRQLIDEQTFADARLPSEPELTRLLGASRATVRQALSQLEAERIITRKHGVGTFVNHRVLSIGTRLDEVWDFQEMIQLAGYEPGVQHIDMSLDPAPDAFLSTLALEPGDEVLTTANLFLADGVPVIYCVDVIPARLVRRAYNDEELHGPVYTFLERRCDQRVSYNITEILAVVADEELAERLQTNAGAPLHYFEETGFNSNDEPIIYSEEYYSPSYFEFKIVRKMTTRR
ncbi:MAG TPA: GntR family transcriptional regulator [Candidatus Sulfomarinibacteraceae bacterium]|nr:GntR family transcriptional regulator [Candidatus Sulfomarinibacteraceae bacterium]